MPPPHMTVIDEAMAADSVTEDATAEAAPCRCDSLHVYEPTLTQMVEEGIDEAGNEEEDDDLI